MGEVERIESDALVEGGANILKAGWGRPAPPFERVMHSDESMLLPRSVAEKCMTRFRQVQTYLGMG